MSGELMSTQLKFVGIFYRLWWRFSVFVLVFSLFPVVALAGAVETTPVKIGVLAKRGHERVLERWKETAAYLSAALPRHRFVIVPLDFDDVRLAAMSKSVDFLILNSAYYVDLELDYGLRRIAMLENLKEEKTHRRFGGVIFARAERDDIQTLKDLVGKDFWAVDRESLGGWMASWRELFNRGIDPDRDFALLKFAHTHDAVVRAVQDGKADAGTVRTGVLEDMAATGTISLPDFKLLHDQRAVNDVNFLLSTRLYPEWPFATLPHVTGELARQVAAALLAMPSTSPAARAAQIRGWTKPLDDQPVRELLKELHLSLYEKHLEEISLMDFARKYWLETLFLLALFVAVALFAVYKSYLNRQLDRRVEEKSQELYQQIEERKEVEKRLHSAEKMEAIGLMASGVAHDLNNILSGIISYPELLLLRLSEESPLRQPLNSIKDSGLRAAAVVADLLTVARDAAKTLKPENLNLLLLTFLQSPEAEKIRVLYPELVLETELAENLDSILCSSAHVHKCIMNLALNAAEATSGAGRVLFSTQMRAVTEAESARLSLSPGNYVTLSVLDNGPGILDTDRDKIFEPFYTKKVMGRSGTGLGLAVVWNCMQDHDGTVNAGNNDQGADFTLFFPACAAKAQEIEVVKDMATLCGAGETILVVDDEPHQRDIAMQILSELGYRVHTVSSGADAVAFVQRSAVDLVILDMLMGPGIDGYETYREILAIRPGQKALIASGFSASEKVHNAIALGAGGYLKKPYTMSELGVAVRQCLQG